MVQELLGHADPGSTAGYAAYAAEAAAAVVAALDAPEEAPPPPCHGARVTVPRQTRSDT